MFNKAECPKSELSSRLVGPTNDYCVMFTRMRSQCTILQRSCKKRTPGPAFEFLVVVLIDLQWLLNV